MMAPGEEKRGSWNQVVKTLPIGLNAVTSRRLDQVSAARHKSPEAIAREALSKYLERYNRTNKLW